MKKYMKQLALSVLTLCMIFTLATGNVVNASATKPGKKVWIYYAGVNLGLNDREFYNSSFLFNSKVLSESAKDILINPTSNLNSFDRGKFLKGLYSEEQKKDEFGNKYNDLVTEQVVNVNGEYKTFQLVGYKSVTSIPSTVKDYLNEFGQLKLEDFEKLTDEQKKQYIDFEYGEYIDINVWNATNKSNSTRMDLASVYAEKPTPSIAFGKGEYDYSSDNSKYKADRKALRETAIIPTVDYENRIIEFVIPEGYNEKEVQLSLNDELVELFLFRFLTSGDDGQIPYDKPGVNSDIELNKDNYEILPGDSKNFTIKIINNSDYDYGYMNDSLNITTPDLNYYATAGYTETMPKDMTGFDGQKLMDKFTPRRNPNKALVSLFKGLDDIKIYSKINDVDLSMELETLFGEATINNLNKYYIDFYNAFYSTNNTKIEEFTSKQIMEMFLNTLESGGAGKMIQETNVEVAETLYNYFYNEVFWVMPKSLLAKGPVDNTQSVGSFMRNGNTTYEKYMKEALGNISRGKDNTAEWAFKVDGEKCFNIYNNMDYGFEMGFKLEKKVGDVTVEKHIELGEFDKNNTPTFMFKLTDSKGVEYFKTISFNEGENDKRVVFKDIPYGKYTVEEVDPMRYEVVGDKVKGGILSDETVDEHKNVTVKYENTKSKDNDFSDTNLVINSFKKGDNGIEISQDSHNNGKRG